MSDEISSGWSILHIMILFLLATAMLMIVTQSFADDIWDRGRLETCRVSVLGAHYINIGGKSLLNINCPKWDIKIKKKDVVKNDVLQEDKVKEIFAETLRWCWYKVGEGQLEPFTENVATRRNVCIICAEITSDREIFDYGREIEGFVEYMRDTPMKNQDEKTYLEYLSQQFSYYSVTIGGWWDTTYDIWLDETLKTSNSIELGRTYLVVYSLKTQAAMEDFYNDYVYPALSNLPKPFGSSGTVDAKAVHKINLIPQNNLKELRCDDTYR